MRARGEGEGRGLGARARVGRGVRERARTSTSTPQVADPSKETNGDEHAQRQSPAMVCSALGGGGAHAVQREELLWSVYVPTRHGMHVTEAVSLEKVLLGHGELLFCAGRAT